MNVDKLFLLKKEMEELVKLIPKDEPSHIILLQKHNLQTNIRFLDKILNNIDYAIDGIKSQKATWKLTSAISKKAEEDEDETFIETLDEV